MKYDDIHESIIKMFQTNKFTVRNNDIYCAPILCKDCLLFFKGMCKLEHTQKHLKELIKTHPEYLI